ncbi:PspA/IM30 family protein [Paenibacillus sedimenti]|uniref:PspA/IM30 family protein n=1 Tax=Paenibacillus sedimenti TaxID=2770274 RepID=A0A926KVD0_9BACL|nr:hypothetical protein [Paenibacillus sedimenti]MBD0383571.1 hypothetical protein [Paenibacillus sedimenti]
MKMLNRIGKMAEAAWSEAAERLDMQERSGGAGGTVSPKVEALEQRYQNALQRAFDLRLQSVSTGEMAQLRSEQAELAMRAGDEALARHALQEKLREEAACEHYRAQYASCQDEVLALAEELRLLRASLAAGEARGGYASPRDGGMQPQGGLHEHGARDSLRELEVAGRELSREALQGLREAGRLSRETLKEAGGNLQHEWHALRGKLQHEWQHRRASDGDDVNTRGRK